MIYLDNASTTMTADFVIEQMLEYMSDKYGNPGTKYAFGEESAKAIAQARKSVADFIGARPDQIIFTSGGTEANNLALFGTQEYLCKVLHKTRVLTTEIEHDSILHSIERLPAMTVRPAPSGKISPAVIGDVLGSYCGDQYGLVSVMHTNNETGVANDVASIGKICRERGVLFHVDCVQAAGCHKLDVNEIGCDLLSLSSHKIHGPKGVGALYVRHPSILTPMICGGGNQEFGIRGGTENVPGIVGFGAACQYINEHFDETSQKMTSLRNTLLHYLKGELEGRGLGGIMQQNGEVLDDEQGKTLSLRFDGIDGETLLMMLDTAGVCVSAGSACRSHEHEPSRVLTAMGIDAEDAMNTIRLSVSRYNSATEMYQAARIIARCVGKIREMGLSST